MSNRRKAGQVIYKVQNAGFLGQGGFGVTQEEDTDDMFPCVLSCGDEACVEWINVWMLPGDTREEAEQALKDERYIGAAYHVSECSMLDDKE